MGDVVKDMSAFRQALETMTPPPPPLGESVPFKSKEASEDREL